MKSERLKQIVSVYFGIINGQRTRIRLPMMSLEFLISLNISGLVMALRSTGARIFPGGKGGRYIGQKALPHHVPIAWKSGILTLPEP